MLSDRNVDDKKMRLREPTTQKMVFNFALHQPLEVWLPALESPPLHLGARAPVSSQHLSDCHVHPQAKVYLLELHGWHFECAGIGEVPGYQEDSGGSPLTPHL